MKNVDNQTVDVVIDFQSMEKAKQNKTLIGTKNCTHIFQNIF